MEDDCFYSTSSSPLADLPPFIDRFRDIPEPIRSHMIEASLSALSQHIEHTMSEVRSLKEPCWDCIQQLEDAVMAADNLGLEGVENYWSALAHWSLEFENWERERAEKENRYGRWIWLYDIINTSQSQDVNNVDDDEVLEIYD